jgi:cell wall integrity and stress response component
MMFTTSALLAFAAAVDYAAAQATGVQAPIANANVGGPTSQGCFKSPGGDWDFYEVQGMSTGACHGREASNEGVCWKMTDKKYTVSAATPDGCYCGYEYPPKADLVDDSKCNFECPAYKWEACEFAEVLLPQGSHH